MKNNTNKHQSISSVDAENLPDIQWSDVRVVTTETLAKGYGTDEANIRKNLSRNNDRFIEGVHVFTIEGDGLHNLRVTNSHAQISNKARSLTLWTEKGAARMSKIVDTDEAWSFFEKMESAYFRKPATSQLVGSIPNFSDPAAAARAWADQYEATNKAIGYAHRQAQYIEHLENLFKPGITPVKFCKQLNGVNVQQISAFLEEHNWLYDDRPESSRPAWRVKSYARDQYLTERRNQIQPDDFDSFDAYTPVLLRKGAVWLYRQYLKGCLPMKKNWNGEFTHDKELAGAA
ncbi:ORF6N domain-containing protein [Pectobacterium parmentieri]|uniref:ORF6N domain-containing protein n=1 Tax=Pectobacterium parmentieri TaxID=1905730 RepID=UPI000EACFFEC|nr:ORF6N domain-containing protein [Pectobacterium parmentieri]AYH32990.1 hypothetical protein C5E19_15945 [Pectobacterium parmentieri]